MAVTISLLALFILVAIFVVIRRKSAAPAQHPPMARPPVSSATSVFHAVSIKYGPNACEGARNMAGKRFLSGAAPRIPLPNCDLLECKCRFVHHEDRRAGEERRSPFSHGLGGTTGSYAQEQREGQDRRKDDNDSLP